MPVPRGRQGGPYANPRASPGPAARWPPQGRQGGAPKSLPGAPREATREASASPDQANALPRMLPQVPSRSPSPAPQGGKGHAGAGGALAKLKGKAKAHKAFGALNKLPRLGGGHDENTISEEEQREHNLLRAKDFVLPPNQRLLQDLIMLGLSLSERVRSMESTLQNFSLETITGRLEDCERAIKENEEGDAEQEEKMKMLEKLIAGEHEMMHQIEERERQLEEKLLGDEAEMHAMQAKLIAATEHEHELEEQLMKQMSDLEKQQESLECKITKTVEQLKEETEELEEELMGDEWKRKHARRKSLVDDKSRYEEQLAKAKTKFESAKEELTKRRSSQVGPAGQAAVAAASAAPKKGWGVVKLGVIPEGAAKKGKSTFLDRTAALIEKNQAKNKSMRDQVQDLYQSHKEQEGKVKKLMDQMDGLQVFTERGGGETFQRLVEENEQLKYLLGEAQTGQVELARMVQELHEWKEIAQSQLSSQRAEIYTSLGVAAGEHDELKATVENLQITVTQIAGKLSYLIHT